MQNRPGLVHQVPDVLSMLLHHKFPTDETKPIDDDVKTFEVVNIVKTFSPRSEVLATTQLRNKGRSRFLSLDS